MLVSKISEISSVSAYQKMQTFGKKRFDEKLDINLGYLNTLDSAAKVKKELELVNNEIKELSNLKRKTADEINAAKSSGNNIADDAIKYNCDTLYYDDMINHLKESKQRLEEELKILTRKENSLRKKLLVTA